MKNLQEQTNNICKYIRTGNKDLVKGIKFSSVLNIKNTDMEEIIKEVLDNLYEELIGKVPDSYYDTITVDIPSDVGVNNFNHFIEENNIPYEAKFGAPYEEYGGTESDPYLHWEVLKTYTLDEQRKLIKEDFNRKSVHLISKTLINKGYKFKEITSEEPCWDDSWYMFENNTQNMLDVYLKGNFNKIKRIFEKELIKE